MRTKQADPTSRALGDEAADRRPTVQDSPDQLAPGLAAPAPAPGLDESSSAARLARRDTSSAQRRSLAIQLGRHLGNAKLQRVIARAAQLSGAGVVETSGSSARPQSAPETAMPSRGAQPPEKGAEQQTRPTAGSAQRPGGAVIQRWDAPAHLALGNRLGPGGRFLKLKAHDRDLPQHAEETNTWSAAWQLRYSQGSAIQKRMLTQGLSYGEILALAGDFYPTFDTLNKAPLVELYDLVEMVNRPREPSTSEFQAVTGGRYLDLAQKNAAHFRMSVGANSLTTYVTMHQQALEAAMQGNAERAYAMNAMADHFLTDSFAGAHLRVPRSQMPGRPGGIVAKVEHDLDGRFGVEVSNPRGERWIAYGETLGDLGDPRNRQSVLLLAEAMALSAKDIDNALHQQQNYAMPAEFAAVRLVPEPVDVTQRRWTRSDFNARYRELIAEEAPGVLAGQLSDDNEVRAWIGRTPTPALAAQPVDQKVRMIRTLLSGWIDDTDVEAIERLASATPENEKSAVWNQVQDHVAKMNTPRQKRRVTLVLRPGGLPE